MKRLKIVCILMAILLLAGCAATPGTMEPPSREEQETGHIAGRTEPESCSCKPRKIRLHIISQKVCCNGRDDEDK